MVRLGCLIIMDDSFALNPDCFKCARVEKFPRPCTYLLTSVSLPARFYFAITIAAIDWSALTGLEWYGSYLAAIGANCRVHLARRGTIASISVAITIVTVAIAATAAKAFCFPCLTAFGAALGLVGIASRLELLLFYSAKGKGIIAIRTGECFVFKTHWMASSLNNLVRARVIQYLI
jgi:hypothetical protein